MVKSANDGVEALNMLKDEAELFDLIVTDIEMPNMDGFELTEKVRIDRSYCDTPVVVVSSKSTKEHRKRGLDVGVNAYFVKSGLDETNLLDVIASLI